MLLFDPEIWERWLFFMNYPLFPSQAKDWIEIISSLSYNLLSYFVWLHVYSYVHMLTHTHTHTHRGKTQQTFTCRLACDFFFFFNFFLSLLFGGLGLCYRAGFLQLWQAGAALQWRCTGCSLPWLLLLPSAGSVVVAHGLSCPVGCGILLDQRLELCPLYWQVDS